MRSRFARLGMVVVGVVALVGGLTPPAQAAGILSVTFVGSATISGGLSYPCFGATPGPAGTTTFGIDTNLCPTTKVNPPTGVLPGNPLTTLSHLGFLMATQLPLPGTFGAIPQHHIHLHHNPRTISSVVFASCGAAEADSTKPGTVATDPACTSTPVPFPPATLPNTVSGNCGLATGQVTVDVLVLSLTYRADVHFYGIGPFLFLEGHARKAGSTKTGLVVGLVAVVPPTPADTPGQACENKTARVFNIVGSAVGVSL
jgi:hypothetical protein